MGEQQCLTQLTVGFVFKMKTFVRVADEFP
jgi:hypothetical protein